MKKILYIIALLFVLSSCEQISYIYSNYIHIGDVVAKAGKSRLYKSDIEKIVPTGITGQDSINLVQQYVESWAQKQFMLQRAEEYLPKRDKDVVDELEDYKAQLLIFRFENMFVEQNLDTVISNNQMQEYYDLHPDIFNSKNGLLKARVIKLQNSSPNLRVVKKLAKEEGEEELAQLENEVYNSAYKYKTYQDWIDLGTFSKELNLSLNNMQSNLLNNRVVEVKDSLYTTIVIATDYVAPNSVTPFEYNAHKIKGLILVKRKQELISKLHKEVFTNALDNKKLKIVNDEKTSN